MNGVRVGAENNSAAQGVDLKASTVFASGSPLAFRVSMFEFDGGMVEVGKGRG